jgi:hypothetical protein
MLVWVRLVLLVLVASSLASIITSFAIRFVAALRKLYRTPNPPRFWNSLKPVERGRMLKENGANDEYINRVASTRWWDLSIGDRAALRDGLFLQEYLEQVGRWNRLRAALGGAAEEESVNLAIGSLVIVAWLSLLLLAFYNAWLALFCAVGLLVFFEVSKKRAASARARETMLQKQQEPMAVQLEITDEDIPF